MSAQTARLFTPTPAPETANRLRTVLAWIDSHCDQLPDGMSVEVDPHSSAGVFAAARLHWWSHSMNSPEATRDALVELLGEPTITTKHAATWAPEGNRPQVAVYGLNRQARS